LIECMQLYIYGLREHFRQYYNIMDFCILMLYMASYALRFAAYYRVRQASSYFNATERIHQAVMDCDRSQMDKLQRESFDSGDYQFSYFMDARTLCVTFT